MDIYRKTEDYDTFFDLLVPDTPLKISYKPGSFLTAFVGNFKVEFSAKDCTTLKAILSI